MMKQRLSELALESINKASYLTSSCEVLDALTTEVSRLVDDVNLLKLEKFPADYLLKEARQKILLIDAVLFNLNKTIQKESGSLEEIIAEIHDLVNSQNKKPTLAATRTEQI